MFRALHTHAAKHAIFYAIAICLGCQGFFTSMYDNFWGLEPDEMRALGWWQVVAVFCKALATPVGIVAGYLIKAPNGTITGEVSSQSTETTSSVAKTQITPPSPTK
jgi:hypothetical protein